jgi:hypothetical protein
MSIDSPDCACGDVLEAERSKQSPQTLSLDITCTVLIRRRLLLYVVPKPWAANTSFMLECERYIHMPGFPEGLEEC